MFLSGNSVSPLRLAGVISVIAFLSLAVLLLLPFAEVQWFKSLLAALLFLESFYLVRSSFKGARSRPLAVGGIHTTPGCLCAGTADLLLDGLEATCVLVVVINFRAYLACRCMVLVEPPHPLICLIAHEAHLTIRSSGPLRRAVVLSGRGQQRPLNSSVRLFHARFRTSFTSRFVFASASMRVAMHCGSRNLLQTRSARRLAIRRVAPCRGRRYSVWRPRLHCSSQCAVACVIGRCGIRSVLLVATWHVTRR
jgi:hypothetical protein